MALPPLIFSLFLFKKLFGSFPKPKKKSFYYFPSHNFVAACVLCSLLSKNSFFPLRFPLFTKIKFLPTIFDGFLSRERNWCDTHLYDNYSPT
jgi:hypothetical protein